MPAKKKTVDAGRDVDALLAEAQFQEPDPVELRWRGEVWSLIPISAIDPRLLSKMDSVEGVVAIIESALGEQAARFPMPRGIELPDGRTELSVFLDAWTSASNEVGPGE